MNWCFERIAQDSSQFLDVFFWMSLYVFLGWKLFHTCPLGSLHEIWFVCQVFKICQTANDWNVEARTDPKPFLGSVKMDEDEDGSWVMEDTEVEENSTCRLLPWKADVLFFPVFVRSAAECCARCSQKRLRPEPERIGSPMGRNKFKCPFCDCLLCARGALGPRPPSTLGTRSRCCSFLGALPLSQLHESAVEEPWWLGSFIVNAVHKTRFRILYICTHQIDVMKVPSRCSWMAPSNFSMPTRMGGTQPGPGAEVRNLGKRSPANMDRNGWGGLNRSKYWFIVLDCISVFHCGCYVVFHYVLCFSCDSCSHLVTWLS